MFQMGGIGGVGAGLTVNMGQNTFSDMKEQQMDSARSKNSWTDDVNQRSMSSR